MSRAGEAAKEPHAPSLPSGSVTFLFTDIEGSTQRWEQHGDAMRAAVERHDAIVRGAIEIHRGYVFKTVGDAFCAAFESADDALAAAVHAQRTLAGEDFTAVDGLRVRIGLHSGHAAERSGDYFGTEVNRVARLMAIGHGGQVLVSGAVRDRVASRLSGDISMIDLGMRRLKDLTQPEQVWQAAANGLPSDFPPLNSLDVRANNLPFQVTALLGREHDLEELKTSSTAHRLLSITGSGGVGKTRVALQLGADLIDRFSDGVWFIDLAPISDPELVSSVTAHVLGMPHREDRRVDESIPSWLKGKRLLLIFDNCEHVVETVAALAAEILRTASDVRILTTSRQPLGIGGEVVHRLSSLSIPTDAEGLQLDRALSHGAVALFVERAQAVDPHFAVNDDTAPIVVEICRRLDGIPLAIELAAARVRVLSIPNLAQRLNERFKLLTGGTREALPRQKTLTALIDWSHDLLNPREQSLFRRLGVFAGGFSLDSAISVCAGEELDEIEILDLLASLTDKSLVVADTSGKQERYHLLESTRAYALEKLASSAERERFARSHAEHFRDRAQTPHHRSNMNASWLEQNELELDNFRSALEWSISKGNDPVLGAAIIGLLGQLFTTCGLNAERMYWVELALARISEAEHPLVAAWLIYSIASEVTGKRKYEAALHAIQLCESVGEERLGAFARKTLAYALYQMGRVDEACEEIARALVAMRSCGDVRGIAGCLGDRGTFEGGRGDYKAARDYLARSVSAYQESGNEAGAARQRRRLAEVEFDEGHPEEAIRLASEAMEVLLRGKDTTSIAITHVNIAAYRVAVGDLEGARHAAHEGVRLARKVGKGFTALIGLQHLAMVSCLGSDPKRAARLLGYIDARFSELEVTREPTEKREYAKLLVALGERLSESEIAELAADGATWSEVRVFEEALKV